MVEYLDWCELDGFLMSCHIEKTKTRLGCCKQPKLVYFFLCSILPFQHTVVISFPEFVSRETLKLFFLIFKTVVFEASLYVSVHCTTRIEYQKVSLPGGLVWHERTSVCMEKN